MFSGEGKTQHSRSSANGERAHPTGEGHRGEGQAAANGEATEEGEGLDSTCVHGCNPWYILLVAITILLNGTFDRLGPNGAGRSPFRGSSEGGESGKRSTRGIGTTGLNQR